MERGRKIERREKRERKTGAKIGEHQSSLEFLSSFNFSLSLDFLNGCERIQTIGM